MTSTKKLWIGIGILLLLSPLGVILPKMFGAQGAWGEWGLQEIEKMAGFVPEGMKKLAETWKAPLPEYGLPDQGKGLVSEGFGYLVTGIVGVALAAGIMYLLTKLMGKKNGTK
jgi:hypothetical protein